MISHTYLYITLTLKYDYGDFNKLFSFYPSFQRSPVVHHQLISGQLARVTVALR